MPRDVKEGLKLGAMAAGGLGLRVVWVMLRVLATILIVGWLVHYFLIAPREEAYQKAMQSAATHEQRNPPTPSSALPPGKYRYHYDFSDDEKRRLLEAWPKQLAKVYVVVPQDALPNFGISEEMRLASSEEGRVAAKDFAQMLWNNSIDASLVNESKQQRYRPKGVQLVVGTTEDGTRAVRPPDVDLLLAVFNAAKIPVSCCASDPAVPESGVGIAIGGPY